MHIRARIHRWVLWWFYVGVVCGGVALVNILGRDLSRTQERIILLLGVFHWALGGLLCWACDGIQIEESHPRPNSKHSIAAASQMEEHHASDFILAGNHRTLLLPPRH